jgi:hypothetical protein
MNIPTYEQIELMTGPQLAALYNEMAPLINKPAIKKFDTRAVGIKRVAEAAEVVAKQTPAEPTTTTKKVTVSGLMQRLLLLGHDNNYVWLVAKETLKLSDDKKSYVAWNRAMLKRKGKL